MWKKDSERRTYQAKVAASADVGEESGLFLRLCFEWPV
jgi:hypothetical protein